MGTQTGLYSQHVRAGARIVDFGGWDMPLHYGSQIDEHHIVRKKAGMFDVSHMTVVDVTGADSQAWLRRLLANDVARLQEDGKGLYSCMLNPAGGVVDDLIVYRRAENSYRVVVNASTREADLDWMTKQSEGFEIDICERSELIMIAVQGPRAREIAAPLLPGGLGDAALEVKPFCCVENDAVFVARTGYTGEDGWEILLDGDAGISLWLALSGAGVKACGLGARDTLRLEAGLNLYSQDMTMSTSPLESNLAWTVAWEPEDRDFIGRHALEQQRKAGVQTKLVGLVLSGRGVMRHGQRVATETGAGVITSGGFSPTIERSIALARVPVAVGDECQVEIRNNLLAAQVVRPPFVKQGQIIIATENGEGDTNE